MVADYSAFPATADGSSVTCSIDIPELADGVVDFLDATTVALAHGPSASQLTPLLFDNADNVTFDIEVYDCEVRTDDGCSGMLANDSPPPPHLAFLLPSVCMCVHVCACVGGLRDGAWELKQPVTVCACVCMCVHVCVGSGTEHGS